ncbi:Ldh family oxidoreductase [Palleronia caenipelagi]|uniref:Ldh family oxidoreductase n=1 Tax=Palleronia caenipelagi TaxID=2489174 RepID=A0A547PNE0_9RHOB|nr:Ldh family oxidoreductase [Palleronia caenipelagi]TRD15554.1 Ldh family oxidoreductase [Palleronia caenipelagi]
MPKTHVISYAALLSRVENIFKRVGVRPDSARAVARVIVDGERDNCKSHGIYRIEGCLRVLAAGKVEPDAEPEIRDLGKSVIEVDARGGFSNPAFYAAKDVLVTRARSHGIAALVIRDCLHFSALWHDVEALAEEGIASLSMCPSYSFVAPAGGKEPLLGTNPFAFGWPRQGEHPYVFDFATSVAARGEIELHRRAGKLIPEGWAVDRDGKPTTDPEAALDGAMLTFGGHKGSAISTMVELLSGAMLGEFMSKEALDFMGGTDLLPRHGALILALDPNTFAANSGRDPIAEGERLLSAIGAQGARLPSERRFTARRKAMRDGIVLSDAEMAQLDQFEATGLEAVGM